MNIDRSGTADNQAAIEDRRQELVKRIKDDCHSKLDLSRWICGFALGMFVVELAQKSNQLLPFFRCLFFFPGGKQSSVEQLVDRQDDSLAVSDVRGKPLLHPFGVTWLGIIVL